MKNIIIVGTGGFASEIIQYLKDLIKISLIKGKNPSVKIGGVVDNFTTKNLFEEIDGIKFLGKEDDISYSENNYYLIANGNVDYRKNAFKRLRNKKKKLFTLIHPSAYVSSNSSIGEGSIICPNSIVNANSKIGRCSVINVFSSIGHHSRVGDFCVLSPYCSISGNASMGNSCFLGTRSTLFPNINIGDFCTVDSHSYVKSNLENYTIVSVRNEYQLFQDRFRRK